MMNDPQKIHPLTGHPILPVGFRSDGRAIWPVLGGSGQEPPPADGDVDAAAKAAADKAAADAAAKAAADKATADAAAAAAAKAAGDKDGDKDGEPGFPKDKALADMTTEEQVNYWKWYARRNAKTLEKLGGENGATPEKIAELIEQNEEYVRSQMSATDKAIADAKEEGRQEALVESRTQSVRAIMDAHVAASGLDKAKPEDQDVIDAIQALDPSSFVKDEAVDAVRLTKVLNRIIPVKGGGTTSAWPNTGQGNRQTGTGSARDAGKAEAERRFGKQKEANAS